MTDMTSQTPVSRSHKPPRTEFNVYFAMIFLLDAAAGAHRPGHWRRCAAGG
jgi:hypothetical protein